MKASISTSEDLGDLRAAQKASGGVIGDATYDDGEILVEGMSRSHRKKLCVCLICICID